VVIANTLSYQILLSCLVNITSRRENKQRTIILIRYHDIEILQKSTIRQTKTVKIAIRPTRRKPILCIHLK